MAGVFLRIPLRHQEAVIAATAAGIFAADGGTGSVNGAGAFLGIEEAADFPEMGVGLAPHGIGFLAIHLGEFLAGRFKAKAEMIRQTLHVAFLKRDQGIGTAIARTFRTIIRYHVKIA